MTSKVVQLTPREPKAVIASDQVGKDFAKASATSATDEPTNLSSAGSLNPSLKREKVSKDLIEASRAQVGPVEAQSTGNGDHNTCVKEPSA